jgi:sugar phosphate isomerase/epimerase
MPPEDVRDNARLMAGEGVIPLVEIFKTLKEMGWAGSVSPEPIGRIPKEMSAEDGARLGLETAQAVMRKAGIDV